MDTTHLLGVNVLAIGIDPAVTDNSLADGGDIGWCDPDDELIPLLGSDVLVVAVLGVLGGGKERASNNSAAYKTVIKQIKEY